MRVWGAWAFAISLLLTFAGTARGDVAMQAEIGWGNYYRPGCWSPLFVTLSDPSGPREAELSIYDPAGRQYAMGIRQTLALNPTAITVPLYLPLTGNFDETTLTVRDANTDRFLSHLKLGENPAMQAGRMPTQVGRDDLFIGLSGSRESARLVAGQFGSVDNVAVGYLAPDHLPATAIGYDSIDVLMLNQPDLAQIDVEQQRSIVQWVRSGGILVMWPGAAPLPASSPILDILPCRLGETKVYNLTPEQVRRHKLPPRYGQLKGRVVSDVSSDAKTVRLFGDDTLLGYRRWIGLGQALLIPADVSSLVFDNDLDGRGFWRRAMRGLIFVPTADKNARTYAPPGAPPDARQVRALRTSMDWLATIAGAGQFGFGYLAGVLIGLMVVVGPVDWFVLKRLGRQPWTWVTTAGWIGLVTCGAIFAGHLFRSGDVHFRTVSLIDEADGGRVAAIDLAAVYSPQTSKYELKMDLDSWWQPANEPNLYYGSSSLATEIEFDQDYHGNRPLPMLINVWNLRLLMGNDYEPAGAIIAARLAQSGTSISGTITNLSKAPLSQVAIRTRGGIIRLEGDIAPGATVPVNKAINAADKSFASSKPTGEQWWQIANGGTDGGPPTFPVAGELSTLRSDRIEQMLADRNGAACVYASFDAAPDRVTLNDAIAKTAHLGFVRAIVPLELTEK